MNQNSEFRIQNSEFRIRVESGSGIAQLISTTRRCPAKIRTMRTVALRQEAKALIDTLSEEKLRGASEFLPFVKARESDGATLELLSIPGFKPSVAPGL